MLNDSRKQLIVDLTRDLVCEKSLAGHEGGVARVVADAMRARGYDEVRRDELGNVLGRVSAARPSAHGPLLFDSHMDTVEAAGQWTKDPFGGEVSAGRIWGRGTSDMKGALAASICAAAFARQDGALARDAFVSASVNEEQIEGLAFADVLVSVRPALVVICESTELRLNIGGRGRAEVFITVDGVPAHASNPSRGVNALKQMSKLILALNDWRPPLDPDLGPGILEPTEIISDPFPSVSVLPAKCRVRADRRLLVGESADDVIAPINDVIARLHRADPTFKARAEIDTETITAYTGATRTGLKFQPAWKFGADEAFVREARAALPGARIGYYSFCTNAARSAGLLGIPTIGFGPGREVDAHIADESLALDQLWDAADGYYRLMAA
jgi:putative selenium metabolism hydrolase